MPARLHFAEELEARSPHIAAAGAALVVTTLPSYDQLGASQGVDLLRNNLEHHLRAVAAIARSDSDEPPPMESSYRLSMRRAEQGFPLESVLRSAQIMNRVMWDWMMEHPSFGDDRETVVRQCWPLWLSYLDSVNNASSAAYLDTALTIAEQDLRSRRRLVEQLIGGRINLFDAQRAAKALGHDKMVAYRLILVRFWEPATSEQLEACLVETAEVLQESRRSPPLAAAADNGVVFLLQCDDERLSEVRSQLEVLIDLSGTAGAAISRAFADLMDVRRCYEELRHVAQIGRAGKAVVLAETISLREHAAAALHDSITQICPPDLRTFILENRKHMKLWHETLEALARHDNNVRRAAAAMHVHPNTVYYRLDRISAASGRDLSLLSAFIDVSLAITYWERIYAHEAESPG